MPQERLTLEEKIKALFQQFPEPLLIVDIAKKIMTSEEYGRRICTEMFDQGLLERTKVITGKKGRPSYPYGPV